MKSKIIFSVWFLILIYKSEIIHCCGRVVDNKETGNLNLTTHFILEDIDYKIYYVLCPKMLFCLHSIF